MSPFRKWQLFAPLGLTLIGAGISLTDYASFLKSQGEPWFWLGTFGLVVLKSSVALMADAVKNRVMYELEDGQSFIPYSKPQGNSSKSSKPTR